MKFVAVYIFLLINVVAIVAQPPPKRPRLSTIARDDDEYSSVVLNTGRMHYPLNDGLILELASAVSNSVRVSRTHLIDPYTSVAIESTVIFALFYSETFQNIVAFSLFSSTGHCENLGDIRYQNVYVIDVENSDTMDIQQILFRDIEQSNAETVPITIIAEAREQEDEDGKPYPCVNISPAPNQDTAAYEFWQESLIHELVHHLTGSQDPPDDRSDQQMGPTEILARQVAADMHWSIPQFTGYSAPARTDAIRQRNYRALMDTLNRIPERRLRVLDRLLAIGDGDFDHHDDDDFNTFNEKMYDLPLADITPCGNFTSDDGNDSGDDDDGDGGGGGGGGDDGKIVRKFYRQLFTSGFDSQQDNIKVFQERLQKLGNSRQQQQLEVENVRRLINETCSQNEKRMYANWSSFDREAVSSDVENTGFIEFADHSYVQQIVAKSIDDSSTWSAVDLRLAAGLLLVAGSNVKTRAKRSAANTCSKLTHGLLYVDRDGHPTKVVFRVAKHQLSRLYWTSAAGWVKEGDPRLTAVDVPSALAPRFERCRGIPDEYHISPALSAEDEQVVEKANLAIVEREFLRTVRGDGFYYNPSYRSWKDAYDRSTFPEISYEGEIMSGNKLKVWTSGGISLRYVNYGYYYMDGSFSVGLSNKEIKSDDSDNWLSAAPGKSVADWRKPHYGQIYFDRFGAPVAIATMTPRCAFPTCMSLFVYQENSTWLWSRSGWWPRTETSANKNSIKFIKNNKH